jgi:NAD-dependent dihydropyrimidine dehydrogenase PreA subunit
VIATPVITAACLGCGACLLTCPEHAIRPVRTRPVRTGASHLIPSTALPLSAPLAALAPSASLALSAPSASIPGDPGPLAVLADRCTACGECVEICPADAIDMPLRTDALAEVTR